MVSTTDDAEYPRTAADAGQAFSGTGIDGDPVPGQPSPHAGSTPALRGHPGGPGFAPPEDRPAVWPGRAAPSAWQQAQAVWHAAGAEWQRDEPYAQDEPSGGRELLESPGHSAAAPGLPAYRVPVPPGLPASAMGTRRWKPRRTVLLAVAAVVIAAAAAAVGSTALRTASAAPRRYPAARLAGGMFGAGEEQPGRGVFQSVSRVASSGDTVVAVGPHTGGDMTHARFFVSRDAGSTWTQSTVTAPGGGAPAPGHPAQLIAGGSGGWLAVGPQAVWTSRNGQSWTLSSTSGISPADTGDQVRVLTRTAGGFLAAGENAAEGTAVIWISLDGLHWRRMTAGQLALRAGGARAVNISYAAAHGSDVVISGETATTTLSGRGKQRHTVVIRSAGTWLSTDDGTSWRPAPVPVGHGAASSFSGIAADGTGFIAVRPGASTIRQGRPVRVQPDGVIYRSATGSAWRYAGTLTAPGGLQVGAVKGGAAGFTAVGQGPGGQLAAYYSTSGASWRRAAALGSSSAIAITGSTVTASGAVIAVGSRAAADSRQSYLAVAAPGRGTGR
jgi:hypothetical protein